MWLWKPQFEEAQAHEGCWAMRNKKSCINVWVNEETNETAKSYKLPCQIFIFSLFCLCNIVFCRVTVPCHLHVSFDVNANAWTYVQENVETIAN